MFIFENVLKVGNQMLNFAVDVSPHKQHDSKISVPADLFSQIYDLKWLSHHPNPLVVFSQQKLCVVCR